MGKHRASGTKFDDLKTIVIGSAVLVFGVLCVVPVGIVQDIAHNRRRERRGEFDTPAALERARNRDVI